MAKLRWAALNGVDQSHHAFHLRPDGWHLVASVVRYDRTHWAPSSDGLWRIAYGTHVWRGYIRGEPIDGEWQAPEDAMAAVEAHYDASRSRRHA